MRFIIKTILVIFLLLFWNSCDNNPTSINEELTNNSAYSGTWNYTNNDYNQSDTFIFSDTTFEREDPGSIISKGTVVVVDNIMSLNYTHIKNLDEWVAFEYTATYSFSVSNNILSMIQDVNENNIFGDTTSEPTIYYTKQ